MDNRAEVREFLMSRRAKVTPQEAGLPASGTRRVPGLRRSEVAELAGVSVEYYAKLERGAIAGASAAVLDALATALRMDETERRHLLALARAADGIPTSGRARRPRTRGVEPVRESTRWAMEALTGAIAFVRDQHQNMVAVNELGRAFYSPLLGEEGAGGRVPHLARFQLLAPAARGCYPAGELVGAVCGGIMRAEAGRDPHDPGMQELVGELSTCSPTFRRLWGAHDVRTHGSGTKRFVHPVVGEVELAYEEMALTAEPGRVMLVYTAEPGSRSQERLRMLASWAASERAEREVEHEAERP